VITRVNGPGGFVTNTELRQHLDRLDVRIQQAYSLVDFRIRWGVLPIFIRNPTSRPRVSCSQN